MGIKNMLTKVGQRAGDKVAKLSKLSPEQLAEVEKQREEYLAEMPDPNDATARAFTEKLLAANGIAIYNAYLPQLQQLYAPIDKEAEYARRFRVSHNIRYFKITKWVTDRRENNLEKLVNVYQVLSNEECNIALIFHRGIKNTDVYLAVANTKNDDDNNDANSYKRRLEDAIRGNFPGAEWNDDGGGRGVVPCLNNNLKYSVATATNIPTEKSEKFVSQTIEKLLDGIVPSNRSQEYTLILLATPIQDLESRKFLLSQMYSGLFPYASWTTSFQLNEQNSTSATATVGVNVGASAGVQNGQNQSVTDSEAKTESESETETDSTQDSETDSTQDTETNSTQRSETESESYTKSSGTTNTDSINYTNSSTHGRTYSASETNSINAGVTAGVSASKTASVQAGIPGTSVSAGTSASVHASATVNTGHSSSASAGINSSWTHQASKGTAKSVMETAAKTAAKSVAKSAGHAVSKAAGHAVSKAVGHSVASTLGKAVTKTAAATSGVFKATNLGVNFGANFARSSTVTATIGKNEGINQNFTNYNIKHALELLEEQMKRYEQSSALGMWDFAAYVLSEDQITANNVAHSYIALTAGEKSYMSKAAVNVWRGDIADNDSAKEICDYLRELRHPIFGLAPAVVKADESMNVYPAIVTATTALSGKELAYSLNFPKRSVAGLPVIECAEFGRNVVTYDDNFDSSDSLQIGKIFHMNHVERNNVELVKNSLTSHTFVTGSTGSGKSNTVYQILDEALEHNVKFLVIEPAKGEYKNVFGNDSDVEVYGTNPKYSKLLQINPFSFPEDIHIFEHLDRLVEIFNVCWPMYAAMPAVLKSAIEQSYVDCGWNLEDSTNEYGDNLYPTFSDVARNIKIIIDTSEYDAENKGAYKGSLLTRLKSLTNGINGMIFTSDEISGKALFDENVIVDLSRVGSSETKSLLMGMLILKLQEYRMTSADGINSNLKHITVLEEAHNILKRTSTEQPVEGGNLVGKSVEMLSNAIAEMRTYGEGFVIVDQAPGLLDMAAIRNTNTKIIMRLPDQTDRELVGRAANLNDDQIAELAKLPCGVAAIYQNEWIQPVLCKVNRFEYGVSDYQFNSDKKIKDSIKYEDRLEVAELLCKGVKLNQEEIMRDIRPKLSEWRIDASLQVRIIKMLEEPPIRPKITKLAPVMSQLFPNVKKSIEHAFLSDYEAKEWTIAADQTLTQSVNTILDDQVRRNIIQAIMTQYLLNELNRIDVLEDWKNRGKLY